MCRTNERTNDRRRWFRETQMATIDIERLLASMEKSIRNFFFFSETLIQPVLIGGLVIVTTGV